MVTPACLRKRQSLYFAFLDLVLFSALLSPATITISLCTHARQGCSPNIGIAYATNNLLPDEAAGLRRSAHAATVPIGARHKLCTGQWGLRLSSIAMHSPTAHIAVRNPLLAVSPRLLHDPGKRFCPFVSGVSHLDMRAPFAHLSSPSAKHLNGDGIVCLSGIRGYAFP
ncbi:hypothetical protein BJ912DRAFT_1141629 [Pholiota molesta]|nr:hypothetical protein BJ912DRAFT_1141629 [Pholiota molesta]